MSNTTGWQPKSGITTPPPNCTTSVQSPQVVKAHFAMSGKDYREVREKHLQNQVEDMIAQQLGHKLVSIGATQVIWDHNPVTDEHFWEVTCQVVLPGEEKEKDMGISNLTFNMIRMVNGNPGAMEAIIQCCEYSFENANVGLSRMYVFGIRGPELYMLWNDCCGRNAQAAIKVMLCDSAGSIHEHINGDGCRGTPYTAEDLEGMILNGND